MRGGDLYKSQTPPVTCYKSLVDDDFQNLQIFWKFLVKVFSYRPFNFYYNADYTDVGEVYTFEEVCESRNEYQLLIILEMDLNPKSYPWTLCVWAYLNMLSEAFEHMGPGPNQYTLLALLYTYIF